MSFELIVVALAALLLNIPLGVWREHVSKFSVRWFVAVHASIPVLFLLRQLFGLSAWYIPLTLTLAVVGQSIGGWLIKSGRLVIGRWENPAKKRPLW